MKTHLLPCLLASLCLLTAAASAQTPGNADTSYNPAPNNFGILAEAVQPDGMAIIGGDFTAVAATARSRIARITTAGALDTFDPNANGQVSCVAVQPDGKVLIGGAFTTIGGTARNRIARVNANGTLDTSFNPNANGQVGCMAVQPDGKILIGGFFTTLQPNGAASPTTRNYVARLNDDGTLDTSFNPTPNNFVYCLAVQPDGKILMGGTFTVSATTKNYITRLNANGTLDSGFNPDPFGGTTRVSCIALQSDGKVLFGGVFSFVGATQHFRIARVDANGTLETGFDPLPSDQVTSIAVQTDGKIILSGYFTTLQPNGAASATTRNRIARVNADGTLDAVFNPNANSNVYGIALQTDGKALICGEFTTLQGATVSRSHYARLYNDAATSYLTAPSASQVTWSRVLASQEVLGVTFEVSSDGGTNWSSLGNGTRVGTTSDWQLTGLSLPASGSLRARGRTGGGYGNGSAGLLEQVNTFTAPTPEIAVEQPAGTDLTDGVSSIDFGSVPPGTPVVKTFTVKNTGTGDLTGLMVTKDGADAADFTIDTLGATTVASGGSTTFDVAFNTATAGAKAAAIHIASNDANENPFDIALSGTGLAPEILVEQPSGTSLTDGSASVDYGTVNLGSSSAAKTFTIRNTGAADLTGIGVTQDGGADFVVDLTGMSSTLTPGNSTTFSVTFTPGVAGTRGGALHIASNDADENPFDIALAGIGNTLPSAGTSSASATTGDMTTVTLPFTSPDADGQTVTVQTIGASGGAPFSLGSVSGNMVPMTGATNAVGMGMIDFTVSDGFGGTANGTVNVTVTDNDAPTFSNVPANVIVEAASAAGTVVNFTAPSVNDNIGVTSSMASHTSGSTFPIGMTTVEFSAQDAAGNAGMASFTVMVQDTIAPVVNAHANVTVEATSAAGAIVNYAAATANDAVGVTSITYSQNSATTFPLGTTTVTITAKDAANNMGTGTFDVIVQDTTGPVVTVPADIVVPATGPGGAVVNFNVSADDAVDGAVTATANPPSGSTFPIGSTTVNVSAQDSRGNMSSESFDVNVVAGPEIVVEQPAGSGLTDGSASVAFGTVTVGNNADRVFTIKNIGTADLTGLGITIDGADPGLWSVTANPTAPVTTSGSTTFTVRFAPTSAGAKTAALHIASNDADENPFDIALTGTGNSAPTLTLPASPVVAEATSASGATVNFNVSASDAEDDPDPTPTANPTSGSLFAIGDTTVNVAVTDSGGITTNGSFTVRVQDTTGPVVTVPADIVTVATSAAGAVVNFAVSANDAVDGARTATPDHASGSTFALGMTTVNVTAQDSRGNVGNASFKVTVQPSPSANLSALSIAGATLSPAFTAATTSYNADVGNAVTSATISATAAFAAATIQQTPANPVALNVGDNAVQVKVTAQDGTTMKTYTVTITRSAPETTKPVVKITAPTTRSVTGNFTLTGTVKEANALASFAVMLNGALLTLDAPLAFVDGVANWSIAGVAPENGTNAVLAEAVDVNGNRGTATKTLTFVNNRPELAGTYNALLIATGAPTLDTIGLVSVKVAATGAFTGKATLSGVTKSFSGVLENDGVARFKPALGESFELFDRAQNLGALAFTVSTPAGISGTLGVLAQFAGKVAPYSSINPVPAAFLNQLTKGFYTVAFPSKAQTPPLAAGAYPQGDGYATLTLRNTGGVKLVGKLADGSKYAASGLLRADASAALFTQLYAKLGAFAGELTFANLADTDVSGTDFLWLRPALLTQKFYPNGWPAGIRVDAAGTAYAKPASLDFGQGAADLVNGNASLDFTDGLLTAPVMQPVSVDPATGAVKTIQASGAPYKLSLATSTGILSGSFTHTDTKRTNFFGILLNKGANRGGFGYFLSVPTPAATGQSGGMSLDPGGP